MKRDLTAKNAKVLDLFGTTKTIYSIDFEVRHDSLFIVRHDNSWIYTGDGSMMDEACDLMVSRLKKTIEQMPLAGFSRLWIESSVMERVYCVGVHKNGLYFQQSDIRGSNVYGNYDATAEEIAGQLRETFHDVLTAGLFGVCHSVNYKLTLE